MQLTTYAALLSLLAKVAYSQSCISGDGSTTFDMYMPYHKKTVTVPPIPAYDRASWSYAGDNAMVSIPAKCLAKHQSKLGSYGSNWNDRQPGGPTGMFYMRISPSTASETYALLQQMTDCACGLVVLVHGTSGIRWQSGSYGAMMSGLGYVVVAPDSHAMPASWNLKGVEGLAGTEDLATTNYCGALDAYKKRCGTWEHPFCYSTKVENVLHDSAKSREYVERNYLIRKFELDSFFESRMPLIDAFTAKGKFFLFGRSEGAMTAGRYYHSSVFGKLTGLILSGWSCEFNYFMSCADNSKICGGQCSTSLPVLNMNGEADSYFSLSGVSGQVAANQSHGYGGTITGNCRAGLDAQGFTRGTAVNFKGAGHSIMYSHDNALRGLVADFLADPEGDSSKYVSLARSGCTMSNGVYTCDEIGDGVPCVSYKPNPAAKVVNGQTASCALATCGDIKGYYREKACCGSPAKAVKMPTMADV